MGMGIGIGIVEVLHTVPMSHGSADFAALLKTVVSIMQRRKSNPEGKAGKIWPQFPDNFVSISLASLADALDEALRLTRKAAPDQRDVTRLLAVGCLDVGFTKFMLGTSDLRFYCYFDGNAYSVGGSVRQHDVENARKRMRVGLECVSQRHRALGVPYVCVCRCVHFPFAMHLLRCCLASAFWR